MKILAVDDDPVILDLLEVVLNEQGHEKIMTARSGTSALDLIQAAAEPFDVFILDVAMPNMDGVTLCREIRAMPDCRDTPIIMLTAKSDTLTIESAFSAGANDYITKPFDVKGIYKRLQVAGRMIQEMPKTCVVTTEANWFQSEYGIEGLNIEDPFKISGLCQHTDLFSLGNYLAQLDANEIVGSSAAALQICGFEEIFDICSPVELLKILERVSQSLTSAIDNEHLLSAYAGSGKFICVVTEYPLQAWPCMEERVNEYLMKCSPLSAGGTTLDISVIIGRAFRPNASNTKRVGPTYDRALNLLENRRNALSAGPLKKSVSV